MAAGEPACSLLPAQRGCRISPFPGKASAGRTLRPRQGQEVAEGLPAMQGFVLEPQPPRRHTPVPAARACGETQVGPGKAPVCSHATQPCWRSLQVLQVSKKANTAAKPVSEGVAGKKGKGCCNFPPARAGSSTSHWRSLCVRDDGSAPSPLTQQHPMQMGVDRKDFSPSSAIPPPEPASAAHRYKRNQVTCTHVGLRVQMKASA